MPITFMREGQWFCGPHERVMLKDTVPVVYGSPRYDAALIEAEKAFPNSNTYYPGGCVVNPDVLTAEVSYCPTCRALEKAWTDARRAKVKSDLQEQIAHTKSVNDRNGNGDSLLHLATRAGFPDVVAGLIKKGAYVRATNNNLYTPLLIAAMADDVDSARLLLDAHADVNAETLSGRTPLSAAASDGTLKLAQLLVERGATVRAEDIEAAKWNYRHQEVANYLLQHGSKR